MKQASVSAVSADEIARLRAVIGKLSRHLRPTAASASLTPTQRQVLFELVRAGTPVRIGDLATQEGLNPTLLSRVIGHLVQAGLVVRVADTADRRSATVTATAKGRRLRDRARSERNDVLAHLLAQASDDDRDALLAALPALETLAEAMKELRS